MTVPWTEVASRKRVARVRAACCTRMLALKPLCEAGLWRQGKQRSAGNDDIHMDLALPAMRCPRGLCTLDGLVPDAVPFLAGCRLYRELERWAIYYGRQAAGPLAHVMDGLPWSIAKPTEQETAVSQLCPARRLRLCCLLFRISCETVSAQPRALELGLNDCRCRQLLAMVSSSGMLVVQSNLFSE